jgi:hypothetical protein
MSDNCFSSYRMTWYYKKLPFRGPSKHIGGLRIENLEPKALGGGGVDIF